MMTILIVDDSHISREVVAGILKNNSIKIIEASDGKEALSKIEAHKPDLIITDLIMPQMNGYELCRSIKTNTKTKDIPLLVCSSKKEEFDRYWAMKQGADAYIAKPFAPAELLSKIQELFKNNKIVKGATT